MSNLKKQTHEVVAAMSASVASAQAKCRAHHTGPWAIEPEWFAKTVDMINRGQLRPRGDTTDPEDDDDAESGLGPYKTVNGIAVIPIAGAMMKARSKYGGTSTIDSRNAIRAAANDGNVSAILIHIDSPGGTTAGTDALAQDVVAANGKKPVYAHIEDMGASAAYWVASQARRITASQGSLVGSLGTRMSIVDSSAAAAQEGLKVLSFSSGEFKAAGLDGTVITDRQAAYFQQIVDDANAHFKSAVGTGRGLTQDQVNTLFDGRVHDAAEAKTLGLIDDVSTLDAAVAAILSETSTMNAEDFKQYAAANPNDPTVTDLQFKSHQAGAASAVEAERKRPQAIADACGSNHSLALKAIVAGHDVAAVQLAAEAVAEVKGKVEQLAPAASTDLAAKDAEIAKLTAKLELLETAQSTVPTRSGQAGNKPNDTDGDDVAATAKSEWDDLSSSEKGAWVSEKAYIDNRVYESKHPE